MFYCGNILETIFPDPHLANSLAIGVQGMQLVVTLASSLFMDRAGRKPLLILGMNAKLNHHRHLLILDPSLNPKRETLGLMPLIPHGTICRLVTFPSRHKPCAVSLPAPHPCSGASSLPSLLLTLRCSPVPLLPLPFPPSFKMSKGVY